MRIIFKNKDNSIGIITPSDDVIYRLNGLIYIDTLGREQYKEVSNEEWIKATEYAVPLLAEKDVPHDLPYWIVESSTIPTDRTFRSAWEIDESFGEPDGFGGESNEFDAELLKAYYGELNDSNK